MIFVFEGFSLDIQDGIIRHLNLGREKRLTLSSYDNDFNSIEFSKVREEFLKVGNAKKSRVINYREDIRYGGGGMLLMKTGETDGYRVALVHRDKNAPRDPNLLDICAGLGDSSNPEEVMIRETIEEILIFRKDKGGTVSIFPRPEKGYVWHQEKLRKHLGDLVSKVGFEVVGATDAVTGLISPADSPVISIEDSRAVDAGVSLGTSSIEFTKFVTVELEGSINQFLFADGELAGHNALDREIFLISPVTGEVRIYRRSGLQRTVLLEDLLKEEDFVSTREASGTYVTGKVRFLLENWNSTLFGDRGNLIHLVPEVTIWK